MVSQIELTMKKLFIFVNVLIFQYVVEACQCPVIEWTKETADKNEVILIGVIKNVFVHQNDYTVAEMEVLDLFKGNPSKTYKVLFPENDECAVPVNVGEEWIIYGEQKQINSCKIEWCGLSRKKFQNDMEDFFIATHIITYDEELNKLLSVFPRIKLPENDLQLSSHKNIIPGKYEMYIYLLLSLIGFLIVLQFTKKYLK
ncbi:MAG: hypothetical protein KatS3mg028_0074 [Bacteroidia bacterium]|nr:MAG: hypothetical protein KatS3mg028_0074 [Bacteroidia bacterium]